MDERIIREQIVYLLKGGGAHRSLQEVIAPLSLEDSGRRPAGFTHSIWELVEHMRICQWDILEFTLQAGHVSPAWPDGYWPEQPAPEDLKTWEKTTSDFFNDLEKVIEIARDDTIDLSSTIPHGTGQTVVRELLLVADHNTYHLGQVLDVLSGLKRT